MSTINYLEPDYSAIFAERAKRLAAIRQDLETLNALRVHYRHAPWDFVNDWGMTFEPRNLERGLISAIPFVLWPRQEQYLQWVHRKWQAQERGLVEKSRDCGVSWLSVGYAVAMWLFVPGFTIGFGSRKEELVDRKGDPKSIFEKARFFISHLPVEFLPAGFSEKTCCAHMRIVNPDTGATITGEAGDEIGRGGRASMYIVDEAAFVEHQDTVDAALSQTTNCQIDISTPNGNGNAFYRKRMRFNGTDRVFVFDWRDDPRKDDDWYAKQKSEQSDVTVAQEIDRDYNASSEDAFIPAKWVAAAIDAHKRLGFMPSGIRATGFDPADVGDAKAIVNRYGSVITQAKQLTEGDAPDAVQWAFAEADDARSDVFKYDGDGMGAPLLKQATRDKKPDRMRVEAYHGSAAVLMPGAHAKSQPKNGKSPVDMYANYRAQTWSWVRDRFQATYEATQRAQQGLLVNADPESLISISSACEDLHDLQAELSRPKRKFSNNGKIQVESKADMRARGVSSPNLADAAIIAMSAMPEPVRKPRETKETDYSNTGAQAWMG